MKNKHRFLDETRARYIAPNKKLNECFGNIQRNLDFPFLLHVIQLGVFASFAPLFYFFPAPQTNSIRVALWFGILLLPARSFCSFLFTIFFRFYFFADFPSVSCQSLKYH